VRQPRGDLPGVPHLGCVQRRGPLRGTDCGGGSDLATTAARGDVRPRLSAVGRHDVHPFDVKLDERCAALLGHVCSTARCSPCSRRSGSSSRCGRSCWGREPLGCLGIVGARVRTTAVHGGDSSPGVLPAE
jgi:hypothetical protein